MSLYNHFKSKDALIAAWLRQRDANWRQWFQETVEKQATAAQQFSFWVAAVRPELVVHASGSLREQGHNLTL